jgi:glucosamine-6-phosphate deaminase
MRCDDLPVTVAGTNEQVGQAVAAAFAEAARQALAQRDSIAVVVATGNSQLTFARALRQRSDIDWSRITVLHMDEYLGMAADHPASFRRWIRQNIVEPLHPRGFEPIRGDHVPVAEEVARYRDLLDRLRPSITVMGIGENGHLAFNDPPADFAAAEVVQVVDLDEACRRQQVGEGHFATLDDTPRQAISLTIPALLASPVVLVGVPEARKAAAVRAALEGPVDPMCPASILRRTPWAHVYLDQDSASLLSATKSAARG